MITLDINNCSNELLKAIARESPNIDTIKKVLMFNEKLVYLDVAVNRNASGDILEYLYEKYKEDLIYQLAQNESTPHGILQEISKECEYKQALKLINNPMLSAADIDVLMNRFKYEEELAMAVISHKNTSASTLIKLASIQPLLAGRILLTKKVKLVEC